jgi:hypothetical protein
MARRDWDVDHLDPRWKEGRDYQLVCGLDCIRNLEERETSLNIAKSNRFLPWRWSREEIGVVPQEPGDLCLFLDPHTNEWVLEEYLGEWWFNQTIAGGSRALQHWARNNPELWLETLRKRSKKASERSVQSRKQNSEEWRRNASKAAKKRATAHRQKDPKKFNEHLEKMWQANKVKYQCTVTGHIAPAGWLTRYQKARGIDPSNRRRVDLRDAR